MLIIHKTSFTVYPVQCNGGITGNPSAWDQAFWDCTQPEALDRETFNVNISKNQVTETSPDDAEVYSLNSCTILDNTHWSCGNGNLLNMPGGMLAATEISRSGNNFAEYGLTDVIIATEFQWDSINSGTTN